MRRRRLLAAVAVVLLAGAIARAGAADAPTVLVNQGIGAARMGESQIQIALDYGSFCFHGCPGKVAIGELGLTTVDYRVPRGDLVIVLRYNRVAVLETTSPRYRTSGGIGVGSVIDGTTEWSGFHRVHCRNASSIWYRLGAKVSTRLHETGGVVKAVEMRLRVLPRATTC